ncbi:hypothetical protein N665_0003s0055 [Sinapis alba]|nr:hypothetical protein N665_0003s0055 [Sinapis alba]
MTKYVSVHFKFKCRIYSVTMKTTVDDITLAMLEERLYKKFTLDERSVKLALRYMLMVVGCEAELSICDDEDLFFYLTSIDKENRRSLLLLEETSKSDELEKLSRVDLSLFGMNYEVLQGNDEAIRPKAITLYVENMQANQQKELIEAENDEDTTKDDFWIRKTLLTRKPQLRWTPQLRRTPQLRQTPQLRRIQVIEELEDGLSMLKLQEFPSKKAIQEAVDRAAFGESFHYVIKKSDRRRLVVKYCEATCKWDLRAAGIPQTKFFPIRRYTGVHKCSWTSQSKSCNIKRRGSA